ncbi:4-hydroxythreonine-4-phosphate dehydrogenase PdxA [Paraliomyxa miuraensis]|uniref:4-hydroxythreonine-4-phosphate dehydrogenase PdxA n=1 Tax=Paraliomyxa miuraensis TaxID=376150 RepID=UPI00224FD733|nr:4-hydroxythreonine-4-phosphate dehydrogenase PdxA [Paraliomyxa miuraensis]MCX4239594.1 4-hydroxythreonine-4-phosphate dehydrogenase PdxA [Paraliomyxa miuraensis]
MDSALDAPLVLTQGDPRGIGPELLLRLGASGLLREGDQVVASPSWMEQWARRLPEPWALAGWARVQARLVAVEADDPGLAQVRALERGVDLVLQSPGRALVTAPIDKRACHDAGFPFPGHTEYLAHRAGGVEVAMLMVGTRLRVVPVTIHVALREVPQRLRTEAIVSAGCLLAQALRARFGHSRPRLAVLGLNPHAGERGLLGDEELRIIEPAVIELRRRCEFAEVEGPLPADAAFAAHDRGRYDAVLAMYHDQGLGPFKLVHFTDGVNMTLGLPFVRTSPDHGTALDIAGRGIADPSSMEAAVRLARGGRA